jgi:hypothetical protein
VERLVTTDVVTHEKYVYCHARKPEAA